jgi:hypothetical protein
VFNIVQRNSVNCRDSDTQTPVFVFQSYRNEKLWILLLFQPNLDLFEPNLCWWCQMFNKQKKILKK